MLRLRTNSIASSRIQGGVPRVTVIAPNLPSQTVDLNGEFTYVGRISGNDIVLPDSSVSSRHCVFVLSGQDIILRDLNSSNGTFVNGEQISEAILQLGDMIQCGGISLKFESSVKRPKLQASAITTTPLPNPRVATAKLNTSSNDGAFIEGKSSIAYHKIAPQPEKEAKSRTGLIVAIIVLLAVGGAAAYFFLLK